MVKHTSTNKSPKRSKNKSIDKDDDKPDNTVVSTTSNQNSKKIKKIERPQPQATRAIKGKKKALPSSSKSPAVSMCEQHNSLVEFVCKNCFKELCGHCILQHTEHITNISSIKEIVNEFVDEGDLLVRNPEQLLAESSTIRQQSLNDIEDSLNAFTNKINDHFTKLTETVNQKYDTAVSTIQSFGVFRNRAIEISQEEDDCITRDDVDLVKKYLKFNNKQVHNKPLMSPLIIHEDSLIKDFESALTSNFAFENFDSTAPGVPKCLHWFEWGKKKLNLYDITSNKSLIVDLDIHFKIPSFSRSILLPSGLLFLIGGEEPEYVSRKEVHMYDIVSNDRKMHSKAHMLHKKFDFTLAHLNGHIYVICGKDSSSEVVDTCERYSVEENSWQQIAPVKKKRYAASAVGASNNKVYLFGGRSDNNSTMINEIEEYCPVKDEWTILTPKNLNLWNPVEVCACLQIKDDEILLFGGSDSQIKDSINSFVLDIKEYSLHKKTNLKKAQVFVNAPFLYRKHVYALGNEYYMKHRNLHRYSVEKDEWDIIF